MKPLKLSISGLQSFREEQEIPFDKLSERGVFGIFGPTGSGKSTILDAVTLALFGRVVRANHKTQGILNTSEKKLFVSFLFEVNIPGGNKQFRVDRRYSKKDDISVKHDHSRLIEIDRTGLETVLAEGEGRVTGRVEALLGMKAEDFTRAVVLPQGKFAEFLTLDGGNRRKMLQRLFALERYGKQLTERLNKRVERTRLELTGVQSELAGIGNASQQALTEAEKQLGKAKASDDAATGAFNEARLILEQKQRIWELQQELERFEKERAKHASRGDEIRQVEAVVDAAERATRVMPLIEAHDEALAEKKKIMQYKEEAEAKAAGCRIETLARKNILDTAREQREKEAPELMALKADLVAAQKMEEEVKGIAGEVQNYKKDRHLNARERNNAKEKADRYDMRKAALQIEVRQAEEKITLNTVTGGRREQVARAKQAADRFTAAAAALAVVEAGVQHRRAELTAAGKERVKAEKDLVDLEEQVRVLRIREEEAVQPANDEELAQKELGLMNRKKDIGRLADLDTTVRASKKFVHGLKKEIDGLDQTLQQANNDVHKTNGLLYSLNKQYTEMYMQNQGVLAAKLAEGLQPGVACPVCGSTEHPHLAPVNIAFDVTDEALEGIRGQIEQAEKVLDQAHKKVNADAADYAGKKAKLEVVEQELKRVEGEILILGQALVGQGFKIEDDVQEALAYLLKEVGAKESELLQQRKKLQAWREERQKAQKLLVKLADDLAQKKSASAVAVQKINAAQKELEAVNAAFEKTETECENEALLLKEALTDLGVEVVDGVKAAEELAAEVKRMDEAAETARNNLQRLRRELEVCAKIIEAARREESTANAAVSGLDSRIAEKEELMAAKQKEVNRVTGGRVAAKFLAETVKRLEDLQWAEKTAGEAYERSEGERIKAEEDFTRKAALLQEAVKRLEKCQKGLFEMLHKQNFITANEAADAHLNEEEMARQKSVLEAYRDEGKKLELNRERITGLIGEQRVTPERWIEVQDKFEQAKTAKEMSTKKFIELEKEWRDLSLKHTRWKELEKRRKALERETSSLETLKKLLRGDRFVQFLAHEQLEFVVRHATERLKRMTNERYALLLDSESNFLIRDDANGSVKRPVTSLSGGETFQASLAMALSLSTQIQLRGQHPLEFFFLDEGFGSLDQNSLEVMVSTLEGLHMERMTIGVISHVGELQQRIGRKLLVEPAESNGRGSRVKLDFA